MITSITKEQEDLFPKYRAEYLAIGLDTTPCDRVAAERALRASQAYLNLPSREDELAIRWFDSPEAGAIEAAKEANGTETPTIEQVRSQAWQASYGSFNADWVSTYAFIAEQLPVKRDNLFEIVRDVIKNCGVYWTFEGLIIATEKPVSINFNAQKRLHKDRGLALEYKDGTGVYALNGVQVPAKYVLAAPEDINAREVMKETNVEVRRELLRKVGAERLLRQLDSKLLEEKEGYQLVELDFGDNFKARYLKMQNPSIDAIHIEGVPPEISSVDQARSYRNQKILGAIGVKTGDWKAPVVLT